MNLKYTKLNKVISILISSFIIICFSGCNNETEVIENDNNEKININIKKEI